MHASLHPILSDEQVAALEVLTGAPRVILTGHVRPDGDCIGAQAALSRLLQARGQTVHILNPDLPETRYSYLSNDVTYGADEGQALPEHDLIVLLDCSELSRTGSLAERFEASDAQKVIVDHHVLPDVMWWDAAFHDQTASSTGLLVARIAAAIGQELDTLSARGVFTSMVTDTGWFKYSNTDAETLALLPLPLGTDGRPQVVDTDDALDLVRSVENVEVVLLVRQVTSNLCKLSARSKTTFNVNSLAQQFGGGGHVKASGAAIEGNVTEVCQQLVTAVDSMWEAVDA